MDGATVLTLVGVLVGINTVGQAWQLWILGDLSKRLRELERQQMRLGRIGK